MAIGIILGASFSKVVNTLVNNVVMPPLSLIGGLHFNQLKILLKQSTDDNPAIIIDLGVFINAIIDFVIVGLSVFIFIKLLNRFHMKVVFATKKTCPECKMEIPIDALRCAYCRTIFNK